MTARSESITSSSSNIVVVVVIVVNRYRDSNPGDFRLKYSNCVAAAGNGTLGPKVGQEPPSASDYRQDNNEEEDDDVDVDVNVNVEDDATLA
ncbi:hypothetical protein ACLKA7_003193 [Drosophila subpalustris]